MTKSIAGSGPAHSAKRRPSSQTTLACETPAEQSLEEKKQQRKGDPVFGLQTAARVPSHRPLSPAGRAWPPVTLQGL